MTETKQPLTVTDEMVNRFLSWQLPSDFNPDGGIVFDRRRPGPVGTNLFTATQVKQMLHHVISEPACMACPDCGEFRGHGHEDVCPMAWVEITTDIVFNESTEVRNLHGSAEWKTIDPCHHGLLLSDCPWEINYEVRCRRKDRVVPIVPTESPQVMKFLVPVRAFDEPDKDFPVRCSLRGVTDSASWIEVFEVQRKGET